MSNGPEQFQRARRS